MNHAETHYPFTAYPFTAVLGQTDFKLALLLAAVNPLTGGVLISGPRGSAKSTLAKGLAELLPGENHQPQPFVTLPLGASEEMLIGTLNLQQVMDEQQVSFQPGLLAKANGGVLYIDEINLLPDNLVDQLLDVAASGINHVERDGISHQHQAQFVLLGTMNPDEGELRPQLMDRFGLSVELNNNFTIDERVEIVQRREEFDCDMQLFRERYYADQAQLKKRINAARMHLPTVQCAPQFRRVIAERAQQAQVDGLRADIVWLQAARAYTALAGRDMVTEDDISAVEHFVLNHRRQQHTPPKPPLEQQQNPPPFKRPENSKNVSDGDWGAMDPIKQNTTNIDKIKFVDTEVTTKNKTLASTQYAKNNLPGHANGYGLGKREGHKLNWFGTLLANVGQWPLQNLIFKLKPQARQKVNTLLLDTSGSVLADNCFAQAKGVVLQIAQKAYLKREQICLIGFGNDTVQTLLPMRRAPKQIRHFLDDITAAGGTPLSQGLYELLSLQKKQLKNNADTAFNNYIITDGRVKNLPYTEQLIGQTMVVDIEISPVKRGKAQQIAETLNADYLTLMA